MPVLRKCPFDDASGEQLLAFLAEQGVASPNHFGLSLKFQYKEIELDLPVLDPGDGSGVVVTGFFAPSQLPMAFVTKINTVVTDDSADHQFKVTAATHDLYGFVSGAVANVTYTPNDYAVTSALPFPVTAANTLIITPWDNNFVAGVLTVGMWFFGLA